MRSSYRSRIRRQSLLHPVRFCNASHCPFDFALRLASKLASAPQNRPVALRASKPLSGIFQGCIVVYLSRFIQGLRLERRRRDLNPRAAINDLHPFQGCPFDHLGTSPKCSISKNYLIMQENLSFSQRREWDSNPRALADKRFSRPPRYDHFDISPKCPASSAANVILSKMAFNVNHFFQNFHRFQKEFFSSKTSARIRSSGVVTFKFA